MWIWLFWNTYEKGYFKQSYWFPFGYFSVLITSLRDSLKNGIIITLFLRKNWYFLTLVSSMVDRTEIFSLLLTDMSHWRGPVSLTCWPWPHCLVTGSLGVSTRVSGGRSLAPRQPSVPPWLSLPTPPAPLPSSPLALMKALQPCPCQELWLSESIDPISPNDDI